MTDRSGASLAFALMDGASLVTIEAAQEKDLFGEDSQTTQFAIGLKLFGDIDMRNRDHELFKKMQPAFLEFIKKLKSK